jgi:predicted RNase H-like HicB family nuclease
VTAHTLDERNSPAPETPSHPKLSVRVFLIPNDPGFDAVAADLPGTVSYGDSEAEALENIREAVIATLEECRRLGIESPWEFGARPEDAVAERRVFVDG